MLGRTGPGTSSGRCHSGRVHVHEPRGPKRPPDVPEPSRGAFVSSCTSCPSPDSARLFPHSPRELQALLTSSAVRTVPGGKARGREEMLALSVRTGTPS